MLKDAIFSKCEMYRYTLSRQWQLRSRDYEVVFIGLNPSTADKVHDDPTIRRCIGFARQWGYGGMHMINLFAFKATNPSMMKVASEPIGAENDNYIREVCAGRDVVAMWGNHGSYLGRDKEVIKMVENIKCLGITKAGQPKHLLYLPYANERIDYRKGG